MAKLTNAQILAAANEAGHAFAQADIFSDTARKATKAALFGADFKTWEAFAEVWKGAYMETRKASTDAANMAWSRHTKDCELVKPKAATKDAQRKAEARDAIKSLSESELNMRIAAHKDAAAEGDTKAAGAIKAARLELARREKEQGKAAADMLAAKRKDIKALIDTCSLETLARIEALIRGETAAQNNPLGIQTAKPAKPAKAPSKAATAKKAA